MSRKCNLTGPQRAYDKEVYYLSLYQTPTGGRQNGVRTSRLFCFWAQAQECISLRIIGTRMIRHDKVEAGEDQCPFGLPRVQVFCSVWIL